MVVEASLVAPARGALDIRPRSPLHLMLIGYDPGKTAGGKARLRLTFRDAGVVEADFALVDDSAAAWAARAPEAQTVTTGSATSSASICAAEAMRP